jgi:hypothetical protein
MQSRLLLNLFLLLLVIALAAYLLLSQEDEQTASGQLTTLSADEINRITITHNERVISLDKSSDTWLMLSPIEAHANAFRINTLLKLLETVSHADYKAASLDLDKYGLASATTAIELNDTRITFGIINPINNLRYILINDTVHLIDDHFYPLLSSQTGTLVARELIPASAEITKMVLPDVTLSKDKSGNWQTSQPLGSDAIISLLHEWQHGQAFGVHNYMERESLGTIQVFLANTSEPIEFQITDTEPWLILARPDLDIEYHFNLEFYDRLLKPGNQPPAATEITE